MSSYPLPKTVLSAIAVSALTLSACAGAPDDDDSAESGEGFPVEVESCGFTSTVETAPERAITLNQGATEIVLALGLEDRLAGTAYLDDEIAPQWQDAYESVEVIEEFDFPDHETILEYDPDLIIGSYSSAFEPEVGGPRDELQEEGTASVLSPFACEDTDLRPEPTFDAVWDEVELVATAFGEPQRADDLRSEQQEVLDDLAEQAQGDGVTVFWWDGGTDTPTAGTGEGGPQLVMDAAGATNMFADVEGSWGDVSWEDVLDEEPDVIVLVDAAWSTAEDKRDYIEGDDVLSELQAVQDEAFVVIPFSESTPGVRLVDGATDLSEQLGALGNE